MNKNKIIQLALDIANGQGKTMNFSARQNSEVLAGAFKDLFEFTTDNNGNIDRKTFRRHKIEIFEILEEIINETLHEGLKNQFNGFAEYRNLAWGDKNLFKTPANNNFRVSLVSDGNGNIRRQRLRDGQEFSVSVDTYAIKVGEDFHRFLAGRVDWVDFMNGIAESFRRDLTQRIYGAVVASYGKYSSTYHDTTNLTEDALVELAMHIEARTNEKVIVYGTKLALRRLAPSNVTEAMNNARNNVGYYGNIAGIELREIEQSHKYGTDEFAIANDMILVLPQNADRMIKVINEGEAIIQDNQGGTNSDMMQEYFIANKFGVSIITSKVFGFIKLT